MSKKGKQHHVKEILEQPVVWLGSSSGYVFVEGFCPTYAEHIRLKFYYDEDYAQLVEIALLDSMESYTDAFNMAIGLGLLYG